MAVCLDALGDFAGASNSYHAAGFVEASRPQPGSLELSRGLASWRHSRAGVLASARVRGLFRYRAKAQVAEEGLLTAKLEQAPAMIEAKGRS